MHIILHDYTRNQASRRGTVEAGDNRIHVWRSYASGSDSDILLITEMTDNSLRLQHVTRYDAYIIRHCTGIGLIGEQCTYGRA